jgi:hypothetical protein
MSIDASSWRIPAVFMLSLLVSCERGNLPTDITPGAGGADEDPAWAASAGPCVVTDDAAARIRTLSGGCLSVDEVPEGWTLRYEGPAGPASVVTPSGVTAIENPDAAYVAGTSLIDISGIANYTELTSVSDGLQTVTFSATMSKREVPYGGANNWGCPPHTETCTPHVLWTQFVDSVELALSASTNRFGVEVLPNLYGTQTFTARFYLGTTLVGSVTRAVTSPNEARLLAASASSLFDRIVITTDVTGFGFLMANVRYASAHISLSPATLSYTFVRGVEAAALPFAVPDDSAGIPVFVATGERGDRDDRHAPGAEPTATVGTALTRSFVLGNPGAGMLEWSAMSPEEWVSVTPDEGAVAPGSGAVLMATVSSSGLPLGGSTGSVQVSDPLAGNSPQSVALTVNVLEAGVLTHSVPVTGLAGAQGTVRYFYITIPAGYPRLTLHMSASSSGIADMRVRYGDVPSLWVYDCAPFADGWEETCTTNNPPAGTYYVTIHGHWGSYAGVTLTASVGGVPLAPATVSSQAISVSQVDVAWPDVDNEDRFVVQRRTRVGDTWGSWTAVATLPKNTTSYSDVGLAQETQYRHRVRACNGEGCSDWTVGPTLTTPAPLIAVSPTALSFTFLRIENGTSGAPATAEDQDAPEFRSLGGEQKQGAHPAEDPGSVTTAAVTASRWVDVTAEWGALDWTAVPPQAWLGVRPASGTLIQNSTVRLAITADATGLAVGNHSGSVPIADPNAGNSPRAVAVAVQVLAGAELYSGVPVPDLSGATGSERYYVFHVPEGALELIIRTFGGTGDADLYVRYGDVPTTSLFHCRSWSLTNNETCTVSLPPAGPYYVMVRGWSAYAGVTLEATLGGPPSAPTSVTAAAVGSLRIDLGWTDNSSNETSFTLQRRQWVNDAWGTWATVASPPANATSHSDTGLTPETGYRYRIRACNSYGCSAWALSPVLQTPSYFVPAAPASVAATVVSAGQVDLAWSDVSDENHYTVQRRPYVDGVWGSWTTIAAPAADVTSLSDTGVAPETTYRYRVRACAHDGCSAYTLSPVVTTPQALPPAAPATLTATALGPTSVGLAWPDVAGETSYVLQRRIRVDGVWGPWGAVTTTAADVTGYTDATLTAGSTVRYNVQACNTGGCSAATLSGVVTTPAS